MLERVQRKGNPLTLLVGMPTSKAIWRTVWRFLKKLEIEMLYEPAIPLLGIHSEESRIERETCTPMFITALFTIARTWTQPRCSLSDEWIRKPWDRVLRAGALGRPWGMGWWGRWEGGSGWGTHVHPWLIHVNVWQKPLQYCKVISLQLK